MMNLAGPSVQSSIIGYGVKMAIMARYPIEKTTNIPEHAFLSPPEFWDERSRGLGGTPWVPTSSCAEENVLCDSNDRYRGECIMIHEFSHTMETLSGNITFTERLTQTYQSAIDKGLWANTYAASNYQEYWAEGVQGWFDCNQHVQNPDGVHNSISNRAALKVYDTELAALLTDFFGDTPLRYSCPTNIPTSTTATSSSVSESSSASSSSSVDVPKPSSTSAAENTVIGSVPNTRGSVPLPSAWKPDTVPNPTLSPTILISSAHQTSVFMVVLGHFLMCLV